MYVIDTALAADDDRQPGGERRIVVERSVDVFTLVGFEQFEVTLDSVLRACGLGGVCVGGVCVPQLALGAFGPDRPGRRGREVAQ